MIRSKFDWFGDKVERIVVQNGWDDLRRAVIYYYTKLEEALNVPNTGIRVKRKRNTSAGAKGSTYTIYPNPSSPGEPPRKRTGWGAKHVTYEFDQNSLTARVGLIANAAYMLFQELGTKKMRERGWLLRTLNKYWDQIKAQIGLGSNP